jgi:hypothetical protein
MRGLHGDLRTMSLSDLVVYLGNRRVSGTLTLENGHAHKELLLEDGAVRSASSNLPREYLGQFLINLGMITEDQFHKAYETQRETKVPMGRILILIGLVTAESLRHALAIKFRETLLSAYDWDDGSFSFDPDRVEGAAEAVQNPIELLAIHNEGALRKATWNAIRGTFPRGDVQLEIVPENFAEPPRPGSLDQRLVTLAQEGLTIDELVLALHATDFLLYHRLIAFAQLGAIRVLPPKAAPPKNRRVGNESPAAETAAHARRFLEGGRLREAEALARRAYEQQNSPENSALLLQCEAPLLVQLRQELMEGNYVPKLTISPIELKTTDLAAPERYLLSRVDGTRSLRAIVQVSPLREIDALKYFQDFVLRGLVQLA